MFRLSCTLSISTACYSNKQSPWQPRQDYFSLGPLVVMAIFQGISQKANVIANEAISNSKISHSNSNKNEIFLKSRLWGDKLLLPLLVIMSTEAHIPIHRSLETLVCIRDPYMTEKLTSCTETSNFWCDLALSGCVTRFKIDTHDKRLG